MKRLAIIIVLLVLAIQTSFNIVDAHSKQDPTMKRFMEKVNLELNGPVKKVTVYPDNGFTTVYYFDVNGCLCQKELYAESSTTVTKITDTYDDKERLIKDRWNIQGDQPYSSMSFSSEYNYEDASHTYLSTRTEKGKVEITSRGILDNQGKLIEYEGISFGRTSMRAVREYNDAGQETKVTTYDIEGPLRTRLEKSYTPNGRLLKLLYYRKWLNGNLELERKYEYSYENDRLAKSIELNLFKQVTTKTTTYDYLAEDNFHNWTRMKKTITTAEGTSIDDVTRQIEYYK